MFAATILIYLDLQRQPQIRFLYSVLGVEGSAICEKNHSVAVEPEPVSVQVVERVGLVAHLSRETGGHRLGAAKLVRFARYECSR